MLTPSKPALSVATLTVVLLAGCASPTPEPAAETSLPTFTSPAPATDSGPSIPPWPAPTQDLPPVDTDATPRGVPNLTSIDMTDPISVARTYVQALFTSDTTTDPSPLTAAERAAPLLANPTPNGAAPTDGETPLWWRDLAAAGGYTTVTTKALPELELPDDSYRFVPVQATTTYRGADLAPTTAVVDVVLVDIDDQWRVETIQTRTSEGSP